MSHGSFCSKYKNENLYITFNAGLFHDNTQKEFCGENSIIGHWSPRHPLRDVQNGTPNFPKFALLPSELRLKSGRMSPFTNRQSLHLSQHMDGPL